MLERIEGKYCWAYVTAKDHGEARKIAKAVVSEKLAACANIFPAIESIYEWQGEICQEQESAFILKTRREIFPQLCARIEALHSYDTPCIIELPLGRMSPPYADWLQSVLKA